MFLHRRMAAAPCRRLNDAGVPRRRRSCMLKSMDNRRQVGSTELRCVGVTTSAARSHADTTAGPRPIRSRPPTAAAELGPGRLRVVSPEQPIELPPRCGRSHWHVWMRFTLLRQTARGPWAIACGRTPCIANDGSSARPLPFLPKGLDGGFQRAASFNNPRIKVGGSWRPASAGRSRAFLFFYFYGQPNPARACCCGRCT